MSELTKMIIETAMTCQRNEAQIATYKQMIRDGRTTCPSANGKDLELWEMAYAQLQHEYGTFHFPPQPGDTKE